MKKSARPLNVKFLANDHWACGWIRGIIPAVALNKRGRARVDVKPAVFYSDYQNTDAMVFQRCIDPAAHQRMRMAQEQGIACIYDCDDDFFETPAEAETISYYRRPEVQHVICSFLRDADLVTVSTPELAASFKKRVPRDYTVIENAVDLDPWKAAYERRQANRAEIQAAPPVLGWYASLAHVIDAPILVPALCALMTVRPDVRLVLVGHASQFPASQALRQFADRIKAVPWVDITALGDVMADWTASLAPLTDHPYNVARSPLKWMEPAAVGVPCVYSDIGPFRRVVRSGATGYAVADASAAAWFRVLNEVTNSMAAAWDIGMQARAAVAKDHTADVRASQWEAAFAAAIASRKPAGAKPQG